MDVMTKPPFGFHLTRNLSRDQYERWFNLQFAKYNCSINAESGELRGNAIRAESP